MIPLPENAPHEFFQIFKIDKEEYQYLYPKFKNRILSIKAEIHRKDMDDKTAKEYIKKIHTKIQRKKELYLRNREKHIKKCGKYYNENKKRILKRQLLWAKRQYKTNINFRIRRSLSSRISAAVHDKFKSDNTIKLIGCSITELKQHLEKQFKPGMSWKNYGKWHIDHIIPCASFNLSYANQQRKCFHYTNLQPLWAKENILKRNKMPTIANSNEFKK